jgi:hypothetical protein
MAVEPDIRPAGKVDHHWVLDVRETLEIGEEGGDHPQPHGP